MKIILVNVASLDGKLTKWIDGRESEWSSPEDFAYFSKTLLDNNLWVMGSKTFRIHRPKPQKEYLRIVMTRKPNQYRQLSVTGQLEFTAETPKELINRLENAGYKKVLVVGGGRIATAFFKEELIDELWLTVEPKIFGIGEPLVQEVKFDMSLRLLTMEKLNEQGTLLLKYMVVK